MVRSLPETVVFDLDGTLVDSSPDLTAALNVALDAVGRPAVDPVTVRHLVGHGARVLIERGLALSGGGDEDVIARALPAFLDYYRAHVADSSQPYPGAEAALDALAAAGTTLAICTNKPVALSRALIAALGWNGRFAANLGGDSLAVRKPDPAHLLATIAAAGGTVARTIYVGDTAVDVAAARAARVPVIVAGFGFADKPPAQLGGDAVIDHFDALIPTLTRLKGTVSHDAY
ncbi:phosphoglycolate phosphatase [Glacieibacterium megasporae]|uniref:phosphoglycolate phosphatase n=1 Tax=Glacieibacterium megasporae TaxID=2835787 RepID=UPI001C1E76AA|nr:phosphoglycolate phosphatase [Polymorphobacter megasporae]UAJ09532.1 phosphoglycolate phosphatase [Polymorphobacter megasporae]